MDDAPRAAVPDQTVVSIPETVDPPKGAAGDNLAVLAAELQMQTAFTEERRREGHWINLHSKRLEKLLGKRYARTLARAQERGIIEVNARYSTGTSQRHPFTKSYRLVGGHRHGRAKLHTLYSVHAVRRSERIYEPDPENLGAGGMHYLGRFANFYLDESARSDPQQGDHWGQMAVARFLNRQEFAVRCQQSRYHCLLTQLRRTARKHLRCTTGDRLALVDISACQPLLLGVLAATQPELPRRSHTPHRIRGESPVLLSYVPRFWRKGAAADVLRWTELCEGERLYKHLGERIGELPRESAWTQFLTARGHVVKRNLQSLSPAGLKRACLIPLFDKLPAMLDNPVFRIIQAEFPTIAEYVMAIKQEFGHPQVACLCQRLEAELMIDTVGQMLASQHPEEPVQPIHDAILVREQFSATARSIIRDAFDQIGLRPHLKVESIEQD